MSKETNHEQEDNEQEKIAKRVRAANFLVGVKRLPPEDRATVERFLDRGRFEIAVEYYRSLLSRSLRSVPSTQAVSATLAATGTQSLLEYKVPQDVITRIAQEQAQQIMEKNIIPLIEETAKTTVQEHEKQERARENAPTEKAKRFSGGIFWALVGGIIGLLIPILANLILKALGMGTFF